MPDGFQTRFSPSGEKEGSAALGAAATALENLQQVQKRAMQIFFPAFGRRLMGFRLAERIFIA